MAGGRLYANQVTVGAQNVVTPTVTVRPSAPANDPKTGVYTTFAAAHAALLLVTAPEKVIYIDSPGVAVTVPAGAYDMDGIQVVGLYSTVLAPDSTPRQQLTTQDGASFTNFDLGVENVYLVHEGSAALYTVTVTTGNGRYVSVGRNSSWRSTGTAPVLLVTAQAGAFVQLDLNEASQLYFGTYAAVNTGSNGITQVSAFGGSDFEDDSIRGAAGSTLKLQFQGVGPTLPILSAFAGTLALFNGADSLNYEVANPGSWVDPDPIDVQSALDRLAQAVAGLLGGAIP